jgi:hypothetical protein
LFGATDAGEFFEVNVSTGQARAIGSFGSGFSSEGDLAFAPDGTLFATSADNNLLRIDPTSGRATLIGLVAGNRAFTGLEGIAFSADGRLYASTVGATYLSVDPSTGTAGPLGAFTNNVHMYGLAIVPLVNLRSSTNGLDLTLAWEPLASTLSYVLEAGSGQGLNDIYVGDIGNITTLTTSAPAGTYFIRMRARTARGVGFPSNEVQVTLGSPHCATPLPPTGFTADQRRNTLTLEWNSVLGASSYQLEAGTDRGLANVYGGNVGSTSRVQFNVAAVPRGQYYLGVRAVASCGIVSIAAEIVFDLR